MSDRARLRVRVEDVSDVLQHAHDCAAVSDADPARQWTNERPARRPSVEGPIAKRQKCYSSRLPARTLNAFRQSLAAGASGRTRNPSCAAARPAVAS